MDATFKTRTGSTFTITIEGSASDSTDLPRVVLVINFPAKPPNFTTITTHLERSEARAIASALMGAAAEL